MPLNCSESLAPKQTAQAMSVFIPALPLRVFCRKYVPYTHNAADEASDAMLNAVK